MIKETNKNNIKNIIFDYDGTIHESIYIYTKAFRKAYQYLIDIGYAKTKDFTIDEISRWLGLSAKEMWNSFMPDLPKKEKTYCSHMIGQQMVESINNGKAKLYDGITTVLKKLNEKGYNLIFLSNCKISYMNSHRKAFDLDRYFQEFYCTEAFDFASKISIFDEFKSKFDGEYMIIGDRMKDIEVGVFHKIPSIGCAYGYGNLRELSDATLVINTVNEMEDAIKKIIN